MDDGKENDWMDSFIEEDAEATAQRLGRELRDLEEDDDGEFRQEKWAQNQTNAALFAKRYRISNALMDDPLRNQDGRRKEPMPVNNVLSGSSIVMRYGEGILDFVYADFKTPAQEAIRFPLMWEALRKEYQAASPSTPADTEPEKVYNRTQEIVDCYFTYQNTLLVTKDILKQSLYTMICPPVFEDKTDSRVLDRYYSYLCNLQKEYLELLEFCFDETFYPSVLGRRHPAERFYLYRYLHGYCDRVADGETWTCQELAAQENYKIRAADRPALAVYDRYYRRYAARKKVRQIKETEFKKWRYEAMCLRDDCEDGKLMVEEYKRWMEEYFPNRKKFGEENTTRPYIKAASYFNFSFSIIL